MDGTRREKFICMIWAGEVKNRLHRRPSKSPWNRPEILRKIKNGIPGTVAGYTRIEVRAWQLPSDPPIVNWIPCSLAKQSKMSVSRLKGSHATSIGYYTPGGKTQFWGALPSDPMKGSPPVYGESMLIWM